MWFINVLFVPHKRSEGQCNHHVLLIWYIKQSLLSLGQCNHHVLLIWCLKQSLLSLDDTFVKLSNPKFHFCMYYFTFNHSSSSTFHVDFHRWSMVNAYFLKHMTWSFFKCLSIEPKDETRGYFSLGLSWQY